MKNRKLVVVAVAGVLSLVSGSVLAADQLQTRDQLRTDVPLQTKDQLQTRDQLKTQDQDFVFGRQLMTPEEITQHRNKMRAAKTAEAREQIRNEHHERMLVRAKERGVTLPEEPAARGMGPGGGIGPGGGRNR